MEESILAKHLPRFLQIPTVPAIFTYHQPSIQNIFYLGTPFEVLATLMTPTSL